MDHAFSDEEIKYYIPDAQVIRYPDFVNGKKTLKQLLRKGPIVLLYELQERRGHWTCIFRTPKGSIECFDPYGFKPDEQFKFIPHSYKKISKQDHTHLINLLLKDGSPVEYNQYRFQRMGKGISTCGRHCIARLSFRDLPIDDYAKLMKRPDADKIVTQAIPQVPQFQPFEVIRIPPDDYELNK